VAAAHGGARRGGSRNAPGHAQQRGSRRATRSSARCAGLRFPHRHAAPGAASRDAPLRAPPCAERTVAAHCRPRDAPGHALLRTLR
jgi:hypothetical protein